jgi:hypothetical protein
MPGPFDSPPLKSPEQLQRESDEAQRLERQRSRDCQREQEKQGDYSDTP